MNKVEIIGRLVSDPETRYSQKGDSTFAVSKYTLAVDRPHRKGEDSQADFIRCVCMGKLGEFADQYLHKGMKIAVVGSWRTGSYKSKDGNTVYTNECYVSEHHFCESRNAGEQPPLPKNENKRNDEFMNVPEGNYDEELPFA